jgi:two-component system, chemotaxis family, CheB/CheR fusion protein
MAPPSQKTPKRFVKEKRVVAKPNRPLAHLTADSEPVTHKHAAFPIVGIGCSAGGVEALEEFFRHLPSDPGAAFIVVTHQHAGHSSLLPDLLRRWTPLAIVEARDGLAVEPNNLYVPPAGCRLAIMHAVLHLMESGDGVRPLLPIDYFFCSLAEDQQNQAVGIVLSGTGTDGSLGLKAIRAESGLTLVQEPRSAKFAGMPQNAISLGVVDIVGSSVELGIQLCDFLHHRTVIHPDKIFSDGKRDLQRILVYLRDHIGNDFSLYKYNTTLRRIERRMNLNQISSLGSYAQYLQSDASEAQALVRDLLIGVTSFFRDGSAFDMLLHQGLPLLLDDKADGYTVRAWVPACSTGEEAYSLAMLLQEYRIQRGRRFTIQIFATDIDADAIDKARHGIYPEGIANQVSPERLRQFFMREDSHYRVRSELRDCITFATHNLLKDAPFTKLDLLSCRNFLIYVRAEAQQGLVSMFHYALKPKGLLMLGTAETVEGFTSLFTPLDKKARVFVRERGPASLPVMPRDLRLVPTVDRVPQDSVPVLHRLPILVESIQRLLLDQFSPPTVFINRQGHVVYIQGRTGDYLEPAPGSDNQQLIDMARPELRQDLIGAIQYAEKAGKPVLRKNIRVRIQGSLLRVNLAVSPLSEPGPMDGLLMIVFDTVSIRTKKQPVTATIRGQVRKGQRGTMLELEYTQQRLHGTNTDLQISNEEFKSANEELQSTNEELQSTNEELETTREELQSLNEELITVNTQLQTKFDEAASANDDLTNLVNTTEVATIFLDNAFRIKRFTPEASRLTKLIATDVGRPFGDIVSNVEYPNLLADAQTVLQTLVSKEREVKSNDGRWFCLRIVPYRTAKNLIDGVVLTYIDITTFKRAAEQMKQAQNRAELIVDQIPVPLILLDTDLRIITANHWFHKAFSSDPSQILRYPFDRIIGGRFDHPTLQSTLARLISDKTGPDRMDLKLERKGTWRATVSRIQSAGGEAPLLLIMLHGESDNPLPLPRE